MNLNHLAIFHAVAQMGSVSAGAERLHISQSAVSKQLSDFERHLDTVLFERLPRGVRLTDAGKLLLGYANRIFALESEAEQTLTDLHELRRGRVAIGASRTIGEYLLPAWLAQFKQHHPNIELVLDVTNTETVQRRLLDGVVDIGFTEGLSHAETFDCSVLAKDELVLVTTPGKAAQHDKALTMRELSTLPLLVRESGSGMRAVTEQALAAHGVVLHDAMTLASTEAIKRMVAAGHGYAFVSELAIDTEVAAGLLAVVPVKGLKISRPLYQLRVKNSWTSPAVAAFIDFLKSCFCNAADKKANSSAHSDGMSS